MSTSVDARTPAPDTSTPEAGRGDSTSIRRITDRLRSAWPGWRDAVGVLLLVAVSWHLIPLDGGRNARDLLPVLVVAVVALVACWPQVRAASRPVQVLAAGWALSPLAAVAAASVRAGMTRPVMVSAVAVPVWFATVRVWRRPWGPGLLFGVLGATALRSFYGTLLAWWGGGGASGSQWLALSWHNQAGALTGAFGLAGLAVVLLQSGRVRALGMVVAATGFAGAWLSGSRGVVAILVLAAVIVVVGAVPAGGWRRTITGLALVLIAAGSLVAGLTGVGTDGAAVQPLAARDESATGNLRSRVGHWEAAIGMAIDAPLLGQGPGSYRWTSLERYPDDTRLTSSAHNEYLEVLGERGLLGAAPVWAVAVALAWLVLRARRTRTHADSARRAGQVAAAGVVALLGLHAGMDFDWSYPILLALLTAAGAILDAEHRASRIPAATAGRDGSASMVFRRGSGLVLPLCVLGAGLLALAGGIAVAVPQATGSPEPWQLDGRLGAALAASEEGRVEDARYELHLAATWNPDAWSNGPVAAIVEHQAGLLDDDGLLAAIRGPRGASSRDQLAVAAALIDSGAVDMATGLLADTRTTLEARQAWGVAGSLAQVAILEIRIAQFRDGCTGAQAAWLAAQPRLADVGADPVLTWEMWNGLESSCELTRPRGG